MVLWILSLNNFNLQKYFIQDDIKITIVITIDDTNTFCYLEFIMLCRIYCSLLKVL